MKRSFNLHVILLSSLCLVFSSAFSQTRQDTTQLKESISKFSEEEFQVALTRYVQDLLRNHYAESLPQERYLVALMRLVNTEMDNRIINRKAATEKYYADLQAQIDELSQLQSRLRAANISELDAFIVELDSRMHKTLHSSDIDYKKKKVFEDAQQQPHAILVNVARGPVIDRDALQDAHALGHLGGGGLDVYWQEPWDPEDPLYAHPRVVTLPHIAGSTTRAFDRVAAIVVENVTRLKRGDALLHRIA